MRQITLRLFSIVVAGSLAACPLVADDGVSRSFKIVYQFEITDLAPNRTLRVWCPVPQSNAHQRIKLDIGDEWSVATEARFGNQIAFKEVKSAAEPSRHQFSFTATRLVAGGAISTPADGKTTAQAQRSRLWLQPSRLVPTGGKHTQLLSSVPNRGTRREQAQQIYSVVLNHVDYRKDKPGWGRGDTAWVCDSRFGNCTDFHSLFISLMRSRNIPARFEIGFSVPTVRGGGDLTGYHCWAWFQVEDGSWVPVDISEADKHPELAKYYFGSLNEDRVALTSGRDIDLVPQQNGSPLNFFVAPYVELDGEPVAKDHIKLNHRWSPVKESGETRDGVENASKQD